MNYTIAVTGKGGVGKTTVAGLLVTRLLARGCRPVLAVDADPNTCLDEVLGVQAVRTIGRVREEARETAARGVSKREFLELRIAESLVEAEDFDLIAMGRSEGPGCYCYANNVLREILRLVADSYPYVVIDNEAGLENLSRRIVRRVELMVMVSDPSRRGLETVRRLHSLAREMGVEYGRLAVVVNRVRAQASSPPTAWLRETLDADQVVCLPDSPLLAALGEEGGSLFSLRPGSVFLDRIDGLLATAGSGIGGPGEDRKSAGEGMPSLTGVFHGQG